MPANGVSTRDACSVPGYRGPVTRAQRVTIKGLNLDGKEVRFREDDTVLAQAFEHETDHVNGTLYIDRLDSKDDLIKLSDLAPASADEPES